jgi:hypothetical protein
VRLGTLWLAILCGWAHIARADGGGDFRTDNAAWNGLSTLCSLAESAGLVVVPADEIDWNDLGPSDVLVLLYPKARIEPTHVAGFLRQGGRLLLADDFGKADEALAELRVLRRPLQEGATLYDENPNLPVAKASDPDHPLAQGVGAIVFNHASAFSVAAGPDRVFAFGPDQAAVASGTLGQGRFVVLSDPSVLINAMLAFDGNAAFATNLIHFLTPQDLDRGKGRLVVLSHDFRLLGVPRTTLQTTSGFSGVNQLVHDFGRFLSETNDYLAPKQALRLAGVLVGILVAAALLFLARPRRSGYDADFARVPSPSEVPDPYAQAAWYDEHRMANFALVAGHLRDGLEARLSSLFPGEGPHGVLQRCEDAFGPAARRALEKVLPKLRALPGSEPGARFVTRREFERTWDQVRALEPWFQTDRTSDGRRGH